MKRLRTNAGKKLLIAVDGASYSRLPIKTHVVTAQDNLEQIIIDYVKPHVKKKDVVFISEKMIAITQGRAFNIADIKPSFLANVLCKYVYKSPYGIGLGSPWTMELAIREAGYFKILLAAFLSAITKPFGMKGVFYKVAGRNIAAIDGPCSYTLPPYDKYAVLSPTKPNETAKNLSSILGVPVVIVDANDLGVDIIGGTISEQNQEFIKKALKDNPLGQSKEQTPIGIIRRTSIKQRVPYPNYSKNIVRLKVKIA